MMLFIPGQLSEMLINVRGEILQITKLGFDCFVIFILLVATLLCVKMCRANNP
jgi:hypothetical protein